MSFFNSPERLTDVRASERITQMFTDLLNPEDKAFLFIFPDLLLSLTEKSPDFLGKIYENPLVTTSELHPLLDGMIWLSNLDTPNRAFLHELIFPDLLLSLLRFLLRSKISSLEMTFQAECVFNEMNINTSWRSQHASVNTPMWVETLSSLSSQSQPQHGIVPANFIRATQASLAFAQTQVLMLS